MSFNSLTSALEAPSKGSSPSRGSSTTSSFAEFLRKMWEGLFPTKRKITDGNYSPKPAYISVVKKQKENRSSRPSPLLGVGHKQTAGNSDLVGMDSVIPTNYSIPAFNGTTSKRIEGTTKPSPPNATEPPPAVVAVTPESQPESPDNDSIEMEPLSLGFSQEESSVVQFSRTLGATTGKPPSSVTIPASEDARSCFCDSLDFDETFQQLKSILPPQSVLFKDPPVLMQGESTSIDLSDGATSSHFDAFLRSVGFDSFVVPEPNPPLLTQIALPTNPADGVAFLPKAHASNAADDEARAKGLPGTHYSDTPNASSISLESNEQDEEASFGNREDNRKAGIVENVSISDLHDHEDEAASLVDPVESFYANISEDVSLPSEQDEDSSLGDPGQENLRADGNDQDPQPVDIDNGNDGVPAVNEEGNNARPVIQDQDMFHPLPRFSPSANDRVNVAVGDIVEEDVLCGRGYTHTRHQGNAVYLRMIADNKARHHAFGKQHGEKTAIRNWIVDEIIDRGGRFVKKVDGSQQHYLLTLHEARNKVSQALREGMQGVPIP